MHEAPATERKLLNKFRSGSIDMATGNDSRPTLEEGVASTNDQRSVRPSSQNSNLLIFDQ